ncbi:hypothetical protein ACQ86N_42620 [Puia sp. P3]
MSKKLGFSMDEFVAIVNQPNRTHEEFGTDAAQKRLYWGVISTISPQRVY